MKPFLLVCGVCLAMAAEPLHAENFFRTAKSGQVTHMYNYHSWRRDCSANDGVVKVVTKPQHGKLKPSTVMSLVKINRFRADDPCVGMMMKGFEVEYVSVPGYRGQDSFAIEITFGRRAPVVDTFAVSVE
jgi:hypothetical protein